MAVVGWGMKGEIRAVEMHLLMAAMVIGISCSYQECVCAVWVFLTRHITEF